MAEDNVKRKLTAILSADVVGYSRLMSEDEEETLADLKAHRADFIDPIIDEHRGRIVKLMGDGMLIEFASVVDALKCAIVVQRGIPERNAEVPEDRQIVFRIGINLGDIIIDGDDIYGNGVNVAARLEALSEPGGICISGRVFDQVEKNVEVGFAFLGPQSVKNIDKPINAYKVLLDPGAAGTLVDAPKAKVRSRLRMVAVGVVLVVALAGAGYWYQHSRPEIEPASVKNMALPLPDKPSIAVLPFDNMSGDPEQEYFSDGITEDIITTLSRSDYLFVIARNSTFTYKGKPVKVKQVAEELGVRYVLEGSVRKSQDRVRINAQLIDAVAGNHLWAERYDRELKDIFAIQDEITMKIVTALEVKLTYGEQARYLGERVENIDIYLKIMEANSLFSKGTKESVIRLGKVAQEIIDMAPKSPWGYGYMAHYNWLLVWSSQSPREYLAKAFKLAQKTLSMDESLANTHSLLGGIYLLMRQYEKAIAEGERSVELEPNGATFHGMLGNTLCYAGKIDEGINHYKQTLRLSPLPNY